MATHCDPKELSSRDWPCFSTTQPALMVSESRRRQLHSEGAAAVVHCHACCESSSSLLDTFWLPLANDLCHCVFWLQGTENNSPWLNWKSSLVNNFSYLEKLPCDSRACHLRNRTQKKLVVLASVEESTNQKLLIYGLMWSLPSLFLYQVATVGENITILSLYCEKAQPTVPLWCTLLDNRSQSWSIQCSYLDSMAAHFKKGGGIIFLFPIVFYIGVLFPLLNY